MPVRLQAGYGRRERLAREPTDQMSEQGQWFQCGLCKNLFIKARADVEAIEEYVNEFPKDMGNVATVCSGCYKLIMAWRAEQEAQNE